MGRLFYLAIPAMVCLAQARSWRHQDRQLNSTECCPCPEPGGPDRTPTVATTQPIDAPKTETVTVQQLITLEATTVTVTRTVHARPEAQTLSSKGVVEQAHASLDGGNQPNVIIKTLQLADTLEGPGAVPTFNGQLPQQTVTVTQTGHPLESSAPYSPSVITVTVNPSPLDSPPRPTGATTTPPAVAAVGPQTETVVQNIYQTLTQTVSGAGRDNIEIIIINIITGQLTCRKKHSGKFCYGGERGSLPLSTGALSTGVSSVSAINSSNSATASNIMTGTLNTGNQHNATLVEGVAHPTGAVGHKNITQGRKPTGPRSKRSW